jgi:integrase
VFLSVSKTEIRPAFYSQETADLVLKLQNSTVSFFKEDWNGPVFPAVGMCKKIITGMLSDLGLKKQNDGRGPHTFRHYAATHLYYNGDMDLNDLAIVLGDKPDTIRDNYLHPTPAMLRRRVEKAWGWNPAN